MSQSLDVLEQDNEQQEEEIQPIELDGEQLSEENVSDEGEVSSEQPERENEEGTKEEIEVSIEGVDQDAAPNGVNELRKLYRQLKKENRELKKAAHVRAPDIALPEPPKKPTLEECDYDEAVFNQKASEWIEAKIAYDARLKTSEQQKLENEKKTKEVMLSYEKEKKSLNIVDFDASEDRVSEYLNDAQIGILLNYSKSPATLVYAIGKSSAKLKELSEISDPIAFAKEVGRMETTIKVSKKPKKNSRVNAVGAERKKKSDRQIVEDAFRNNNVAEVLRSNPHLRELFYEVADEG